MSFLWNTGSNIVWNKGLEEDKANDFMKALGTHEPYGHKIPKDLKAGQYFDDGKYMVVSGNAKESGWGDFVPPGYRKIGYTSQSSYNLPKGGGTRTAGENLLILKRIKDDEPQAQAQAQLPQAPETPAAPVQPTQDLANARAAWDQDQSGIGGSQSNGSIHFNPTGNGILDAATYGNNATDDYVRRFIPSLNRQANLEALEIGETGNYHLNRFVGKVPELGDPKDLFEYYKKKLN